ncbi:MAG: glycine oxidase ThiO [Chloroflexi bacterium]|nr:MAG: glycine oxidase ThiO [Chloroflexota bacterium]
MPTFDVAVAGAGIIGSAVAHACARRGARVLLLDRDQPGAHASGGAAGMLTPSSEADAPGPFLDLARHSLSLWPALAAELLEESGVDPELVLDGVLRVAIDDGDLVRLKERCAWQQAAGLTCRRLDRAALTGSEPALASPLAAAAVYPDEGHVQSARAVQALVGAARRWGAEVQSGVEVVAVDPGGRVRLAGGGTVLAGAVVIAAGAWVSRLTALPVRPVRGQLIGVRGLPRLPRHVLVAGRRGYAVAKRDGLVLVGATEEDAGFDARVTVAATEALLQTGRRLLAGFADATLAHSWSGLRPRTPDALPVLGPLPGHPGPIPVLVAGAHFRNGVLLAPATAAGMADLALERRTPPDWAAFDPRRFS